MTRSCKFLKQKNRCAVGEKSIVEVTLKSMKICEGVDVSEAESYLRLKGSALVSDKKPIDIKPSQMTKTIDGDCTVFEYKQSLNMCFPGLFAELYLAGNDPDSGEFKFGVYKFEEYLLQNCKLNVSAVCLKLYFPCEKRLHSLTHHMVLSQIKDFYLLYWSRRRKL